jgi:hypothetical protein
MAQPTQTTGFRAGALAGVLLLAVSLCGAWLDGRAAAEACEAPAEGQALARVLERFAPERPLVRLGQRAAAGALRFAFGAGCE